MVTTLKRDNTNLPAKIALRRWFLRRYHKRRPPSVLDCCQGDGLIWKPLRREFRLAEYVGLDIKPRPGRLKLDSVRYLQQPGWTHDVIDIDTYGSPWRHWQAALPNIARPTTVFLTIGAILFKGAVDSAALRCMGCVFRRARLPESFYGKLTGISLAYCLAMSYNHGLRIVEAAEAPAAGHARYIGVRLESRK